MTHAVNQELSHHKHLRERLEAVFPDADEETSDSQAKCNTGMLRSCDGQAL